MVHGRLRLESQLPRNYGERSPTQYLTDGAKDQGGPYQSVTGRCASEEASKRILENYLTYIRLSFIALKVHGSHDFLCL